jgi:hypothetical protein
MILNLLFCLNLSEVKYNSSICFCRDRNRNFQIFKINKLVFNFKVGINVIKLSDVLCTNGFFRSNICFDLIPDVDLLGFWFASAANNDPNWIYLFLLKPIFLEKFGWQSVTLQSLSPFHWSFFMTCETTSERGFSTVQ